MTVDPGLLELARELVGIPSVNPAVCDDPALSGEARMADRLEGLLRERGFETSRDEPIPGRPNVFGWAGPEDAAFTLVVEGHLDTVSVEGMSVDPFAAACRDGRLYGRGACDMKGPMAAALWALSADRVGSWSESGLRLGFIGCIDEETGCRGSGSVADRAVFRADELVVLEPTGLGIVVAHKGALWYEVEVTGRPGHGSAPERGLSAIRGMLPVLEAIEAEAREAGAVHGNELLGQPTVNIGRIEGGSGVNVVPGECRIQVDRRMIHGEDPEAILAVIAGRLDDLKADGAIVDGRIRVLGSGNGYRTDTGSPLVLRLAESIRAASLGAELLGTGWCSDAGPLSRVSGATVVFGPGDIAQAHTADEWIGLADLQRGADILARFLDATLSERAGGQ